MLEAEAEAQAVVAGAATAKVDDLALQADFVSAVEADEADEADEATTEAAA